MEIIQFAHQIGIDNQEATTKKNIQAKQNPKETNSKRIFTVLYLDFGFADEASEKDASDIFPSTLLTNPSILLPISSPRVEDLPDRYEIFVGNEIRVEDTRAGEESGHADLKQRRDEETLEEMAAIEEKRLKVCY